LGSLALAMSPSLTQAQYDALATDILGDPTLATAVANNDDQAIAAAYNAAATPAFWVWKTSVSRGEYLFGTSVDSTTFTFNGNGFVGRTQGELAAWRELFTLQDATNPSLQKVQDAFADIFSGTGNAAANRTHLAATSRRVATRVERLFVTGAGSTGSPGRTSTAGPVSYLEIAYALRGGTMP
jgi:hypothetical protein